MGKVVIMAETPAKYPIPRDLVERVHVKFITEEQASTSKQDAICRVLERYVGEKSAGKKERRLKETG